MTMCGNAIILPDVESLEWFGTALFLTSWIYSIRFMYIAILFVCACLYTHVGRPAKLMDRLASSLAYMSSPNTQGVLSTSWDSSPTQTFGPEVGSTCTPKEPPNSQGAYHSSYVEGYNPNVTLMLP